MNWVSKNASSLTLALGFAIAMCSMTAYIIGSIHGVETRMVSRMDERFAQQDARFAQLEKDITIIKTVLIMKGVLPQEMAIANDKTETNPS